MSAPFENAFETLSRVDGPAASRQDCPMQLSSDSDLSVCVERGRSGFRVVASAPEASPAVLVEITFSGGADGVWFRLTRAGNARVFSRDVVACHRPLSAILRLIGDEVELSKPPSQA